MNQIQSANTLPSGWHGNLNLVYAHSHGATELIQNQMQAPLKVQRPFYPEGAEVCHSVIVHTAGGVVGGDRLSLNFDLKPQAQALITTAAAGKIYRSNGLPAQQSIKIQVDAGGCIEWLPQETIVFNGAIYRQDLFVDLAPGAIWLGWDINRFGRTASGEQFLTGEWRSHTQVWQQNRPLWIDSLWLPGSTETFNSPHALAAHPIVGSFAMVGKAVTPEIVQEARSLWSKVQRKGEVGVTRLTSGLICRYRGDSTSEVRHWFMDVWQLLRLSLLDRPAVKSRIWSL